MGKIKMGYVGCGFLAQKVHLPNLASLPDVEFAAIAEVREKLGRKVQSRFNIAKYYPDHRALANDKDITAVGVSGHQLVQGDIAADLLLAGKCVFMEKPMALSVAQAEKILAAEKKGGGRLMVGYMKRYDLGNELAHDKIQEFKLNKEFGNVVYVRNHGFGGNWVAGDDVQIESTDEPVPQVPDLSLDWLPEKYNDLYIGYLQQFTHNVNLIRYLLDAGDNTRVKVVDLNPDGYTGVIILEVNGVRAIIESGGDSYPAWEEHTQVYFDKGWVKTSSPPLLLRNTSAKVEIFRGGEKPEWDTPHVGWGWSFKREMEHFIARVKDGKPFRSSGQDTLTDVRIFEEIFKIYIKGDVK